MRQRLLILALALLLPSQGWAALNIVQSQLDASTTPWATDGIAELTFASDFTVGNTVCVGFAFDATSRTINSVEDDGGPTNTYTVASTSEQAGCCEGWIYCGVVARAANVVTVTISSALASTGVLFGWEVGEARASSPVGNTSTNNVASATSHPNPSAGTLAMTDATAMLLGFTYGSTGTYTLDAGFTSVWNRNVGTGGSQFISSADSMVNTTGGNEGTLNILVEIRPAAAGGGGAGGAIGNTLNFFRLRVNP